MLLLHRKGAVAAMVFAQSHDCMQKNDMLLKLAGDSNAFSQGTCGVRTKVPHEIAVSPSANLSNMSFSSSPGHVCQ